MCWSGFDDGSGGAVRDLLPSVQLLAQRGVLRGLRVEEWRDRTRAGHEVVPPYSVDSYVFAEWFMRGAAASSGREG